MISDESRVGVLAMLVDAAFQAGLEAAEANLATDVGCCDRRRRIEIALARLQGRAGDALALIGMQRDPTDADTQRVTRFVAQLCDEALKPAPIVERKD